jgi:S1-C subfamily serine protease
MGADPVMEAQPAAVIVPVAATRSAGSEAERAWLATTLARVEVANGQVRGWRVADPLPEAARAAGLRGGDLVVAVNGARANNVAAAIAAAQTGHLNLDVERGERRLTLAVALNEGS